MSIVLQRVGLIGDVPVYEYNDITFVCFDDCEPEFAPWLRGQTMPMIPELGVGMVAYDWDYERFKKGLPVID